MSSSYRFHVKAILKLLGHKPNPLGVSKLINICLVSGNVEFILYFQQQWASFIYRKERGRCGGLFVNRTPATIEITVNKVKEIEICICIGDEIPEFIGISLEGQRQ